MSTANFLHNMVVQTDGDLSRVWELERRLRENGFIPVRGDSTGQYMSITWLGDRDDPLEFLRPDFLPPK